MKRKYYWQRLIKATVAMGSAIAFTTNPALAQIIPDPTLGAESSVVTPDVIQELPSSRIDGGAIRNHNLFHSFQEFNVGADQGAYFTNPQGIENIFSRVTGTNPSNIFGKLGVLGNANLFLINPNGIIFGSNASLDVNNSFIASTANSLIFSDRTQFSTTADSRPSLLSVSVPVGLGFGSSAGSILVQGSTLQVPTGKTLALIGGDITLTGSRLTAAQGRIDLGSVAASGIVNLNQTNSGYALGYGSISNFKDIQLSQGTLVNVNGEGGGDIQVQGRRVILTNGSRLLARTLGAQPGGNLAVTGVESVELIGNFAVDPSQFTGLFTSTFGRGTAGNLTITTGKLIVRDGAFVSSSSLGRGQGGNLTVNASQLVELSGASPDGFQPGGLFSLTFGSGAAGALTINTSQLIVRDGAWVSTSTFGRGRGGDLMVDAKESVEVRGTSPDGQLPSSLRADASAESTASAGDLQISTQKLIVRDSAEVTVANQGSGNAGKLEVTAPSFRLDNGYIAGETASGEGGNISLETRDLQLRNHSQISTTARGSGNGGDIAIITDTLVALENSDITADAIQGRGGNIHINTSGVFRSPDSAITATSELGIQGVVEIKTLGFDVKNTLTPLTVNLTSPEQVIAGSCLSRRNDEQGSFTVTGTGGLPRTPYDPLSSKYAMTGVKPLSGSPDAGSGGARVEGSAWKLGDRIVEAQGIAILPDGRKLLRTLPTETLPTVSERVCHEEEFN
jgi:filamentous hemagglutinin family protein